MDGDRNQTWAVEVSGGKKQERIKYFSLFPESKIQRTAEERLLREADRTGLRL